MLLVHHVDAFNSVSLIRRRKALFDGFWQTSNFDVQNAYLCGCIKVTCTKRKYTAKQAESRRSFSREYYVPNGEESLKICKRTFQSLFVVSDGRINRAIKAQAAEGGSPHADKRGHYKPANKTLAYVQYVKEHIESFHRHYS